MPIDPTRLNALLDEQEAQRARHAGLAAPDVAPDQMARALQLADKRGIAPGAIAANLPDIEADERLSELEAAQPHLGDWLTPEHAALARDDIGPLTKLAQAMRPVSSSTERTIGEYFTDLGVQARTMGRSALADLAEAPVAAVNWINQAVNNDARRLAGLFGQTPSSMIPMREELFGFEQEFRAATEEVNAADRDRNLSFRLSAQERERPDTFTGQVTQYATDPSMVGTDLAGVFGYMSGGGIIPGRTQATLVTQAISQASGTVAQTRQRLIDKGVDEATASAQAAEVFGAALGIGIVAPKLVPGGQSFERLIGGEVADNAASRLGRAALPLVGEPVSEVLEEGSIQLVQNLGAGDPAMRGVGGAAAAALVAGTGMAAPASVAGYFAEGDAAKTRESFATLGRLASSLSATGRLEAITAAAAEAKTGKRHPAALEGLAPDETVYLPAEALRTLFQQGEAAAFAETLTGNPQALEEAGEHGDLAVPMAKWLSVVAQLPNAEAFARHARSDVDGHSRADLEASLDLDFTDASETAERATPESQTSQQQVEQDVLGMLLASDRYRPADAELQAKFMGRAFRVMGERAGIDPWELYARYKLRIDGGAPSLASRVVGGVKSLFQRKPPPVQGADPLLAGMTLLAQDDEAFQLPTSEADTLEGVVADLEGPEGFRLIRDEFTDEFARESGAERAWLIRLPEQGKGQGVVFEDRGAVWIDVAAFKQGADGKRVYNAVANYAYNTGKTFIGDPAGLSDIAQARRLENMLSSALKFGTTRHLWPHPKQETGNAESLVPGIDWRDGDDVHNLRQMLAASLAGTEAQFPEIVNLRYDPAHDQIIDIETGEPRSRRDLDAIALAGRASAAAAKSRGAATALITGGSTSIERAVLVASLLRGTRQEQSAILARLGSQRSQRLKGSLYQSETPPEGGVSAFWQPADGGGPRGSLDIDADRSMSINLFAGANLSTFLHESGHFFLEVMADVAADPNAPQAVKDDWAAILAYLGNEGGEITTEQHETWARSFEAYLMEGQAPAPELVGAFARFRAWLTSIYKALSSLNVSLTPEVRSVMDRMIATDEEIEAAQVRQGMVPLELAPESRALVSAAQWQQYVAALQAGTEEARQEVFAKLAAAHKAAAQRWYREEKARVREEVEAELDALPVMRAWRILRGSRDESIPENLRGLKLDRDAIAGMFDADTGKRMLERLRAMYRKEGGVSPDTAASLLGFTSGDELVRKLAGVPDLLAQVDAETAARMNARHPDPLLDGSLPETAMAAVHNNKRVQAMEAELGLLATLAQQPRPNARAIRAFALRTIAGKTIRAIQPNRYLAAERKAAREATKAAAAGDYAAALQAKREQVLQAAMYREALAALERAETQIAMLRKAGTDKTRERIGRAGKSYVDALDDLLEGHELRPVSARAVARRASLRAWVAQQQEADNHTAIGEELLARVERENVVNVLDLTGDQLAELHEAVKNLLHLASVKNRLQTRRGKLDWEEAKGLLQGRLAEQGGRGGGISAADRALLEGAADLYDAANNWVLQPETVIEWLDGGVDGPWHDLLWEPSEEAEHTREALQREVGAKLQEAFGKLAKDERKALDRRVYIASMGESVSGHTILSALLNMGTASNRDKLLRGGRVNGDATTPFTPEQLAEMFGHLSGAHAELVQGIWDAVHTLWPHVVALEEELNGITPEKVQAEAVTITTRDGPVALRGGYFPAVYDPRGANVGRLAEDEQAKRVLSGNLPIKASTSKGHTEKRTDYVAPLLLDYHAVLARHLDGVMSDLAYRKFLKQAYKILDDAELARMVDNRIGPRATKILKDAIARGAVGSFSLAGPLWGPFQGIADAGMTNISAAALGLRVPLALANIATAPMLATARVSPRFVAAGFAEYYRNPKAGARMVQHLSPMMLRRAEARTVEFKAVLDTLRGTRTLRKQMIEFTMAVHQWIVPLAENAIWIGAYREALAGGQEASEAVRLADKAIRQTQTKHTAKDLSQAEGNPYLRWAMMFAGPLAVINNRLQESGLRGLRGAVNSPVQALGTWMAMAAGGVWVFELLMGRGPGDEDDDGDEDMADWARWCAVKLGLMPFAAYPILREGASYLDNGFKRANPLVEALTSLISFGDAAIESGAALFTDDEMDEEKLAKQTARAVGTVTGLPSGQAVRTGTYLMEIGTGQHTPANPAAEAVYLLQGPPKE